MSLVFSSKANQVSVTLRDREILMTSWSWHAPVFKRFYALDFAINCSGWELVRNADSEVPPQTS